LGKGSALLKAVVIGFVLGFALVGGARLAESGERGAQLTSGHVLHPGAAFDHVDGQPCAADLRPVLVLT
jgi:hypothetical protein